MQQERVALVTGGSRGIGAAIARRLAADGFAVAVNYAANAAAAGAVVDEITAAGGRAMAVQGDVGESAAVTAMFEDTCARFGGIDVVVSNAAVMAEGPIARMDDAAFDRIVAVNLKGTFLVMREAANRVRDGGRIITLSSSLTRLRRPGYGVYAATKAAVEAMSLVLARELRGRGIAVNAVAPGPTATELFFTGKPQELIDALARESPFERLGEPDDIAAVVAMLAGPDGGWINGQTVFANGGII